MLKAKESGKQERIDLVSAIGYPAYTTSVGWLGYSDEKVSAEARGVQLMADSPIDFGISRSRFQRVQAQGRGRFARRCQTGQASAIDHR